METTTIMVTKELQTNLKILCAFKGVTYEKILQEMTEVYKEVVPFKNETEFVKWLKTGNNINFVGFKRIIAETSKKAPYDLLVEDFHGQPKRIEVEINARDFLTHKHNPSNVDFIVALFSTKDKVNGVHVLAITEFPFRHRKTVIVAIPKSLKDRLDKLKIHRREPYSEVVERLVKKEEMTRDG